MSLTTALAAIAALAAGTVGALTAYELSAPEPTAAPTAQAAEQRPRPDRPRFAPCKKPARLQDGKCVTNVTRDVAVPGPQAAAAPAPAAPAPQPPPGGSQVFDSGDDARRDLGDDHEDVAEDDLDDADDWYTGGTDTGGTHTRTGGGTQTGTQTQSVDTGTDG